jgi:hypothetical protein
LIVKEQEAIGPHSMMFFSEVTKDLQKLLGSKDEEIMKSEIQTSTKTSEA